VQEHIKEAKLKEEHSDHQEGFHKGKTVAHQEG